MVSDKLVMLQELLLYLYTSFVEKKPLLSLLSNGSSLGSKESSGDQ